MSNRRQFLLWLTLGAVASLGFTETTTADEFFFHDGDNPFVFVGDSITQQRMYTTLIESYVLTRHPQWHVTFRNSGWGGDTAGLRQRGGFDKGFKRDIASLHPVAALVDFGMNDGRAGDAGLSNYLAASAQLIAALKAGGTRVALLTSTPEERYFANQPAGSAYNKTLALYSAGLREVATKEKVPFIDQLNPYIDLIQAGRAAHVLGTEGEPRLIPDGIHPNWAGHLVMATLILKGLGASALVSRVDIDATTKKYSVENCRVEIVADATPTTSAPPAELAFRRADNALPWPLPPEVALALKLPGFKPLDDLSRYELKVTGLKKDQYELSIDQKPVGKFSREELKAGVNLTMQAGPITEQTTEVVTNIVAKNDLYFERWRKVQIFELPPWGQHCDIEDQRSAELKRLDDLIAEKEQVIRRLCQPVPHVFALRAAQ